MTESFITQCPHCHTSFRVSKTQLGAAHGAVRCGACLDVFNAAKQLQKQGYSLAEVVKPTAQTAPPPPTVIKPAEPEPKQPAADETLWIHDDLDLDELDLDEELARIEEREQQLSQAFLKHDSNTHFSSVFAAPPRMSADPHDEGWAEALLREEAKPASEPAIPPLALKQKDTHSSPPVATQPFSQPPISPAPPVTENAAEPTFILTDADFGLRPETDSPIATPAIDEPEARDKPEAEPKITEAPEPAKTVADTGDSEPAALPLEPVKTKRNEPALGSDRLFELDDEPVHLDWQKPEPSWGRRFIWSILILLAGAALAGQYVAYHFEQLARQDQYRPLFEQLCPNIGCELPSKVDISQIKSSNLVVRSHPDFSGALVVDAIIYNRAPFSQPFPLLEMRFADIDGKLLASRRFTPGEYLAGELAGQAEMPPQTPIHISLDILDPGSQAVNYSLSFHSPQ